VKREKKKKKKGKKKEKEKKKTRENKKGRKEKRCILHTPSSLSRTRASSMELDDRSLIDQSAIPCASLPTIVRMRRGSPF
jgi:hypothetical protein